MRLHNTLGNTNQDFTPLQRKKVGMYHCGPTVYNFAHIGNLRAYVFADTIRRAFEYLGYAVKQVINITDVGHLTSDSDTGKDKVEEMAEKEHKTTTEIADFFTAAFFEDIKKLNIETTGTTFPKATEHINEQIDLIQQLEKADYTYKTSDGIYFNTSKFKKYGELGNIDLANLEEGARVAVNNEKKNPTDFALWKLSKPEDKRQQEWPSPWGVGFPGWHIECSAMSMKYLGETFDIHTGGIDHVPVHHNNEIAQSESATGKTYVNYWLHSAFVNVEGGKMAKSKDNFIRLVDLETQKVHPLAYRYWLLTAHYRTPVIYSPESVSAAQNALESLTRKVALAEKAPKPRGLFKNRETKKARVHIQEIIDNDFDTPALIAYLHKITDEIISGKINVNIIDDFDKLLGLKLRELTKEIMSVPEKIKKLSTERETFRQSKDWTQSDEIRLDIEKQGYYLEDGTNGPVVRKKLSSLIGII